MNYLSILKKILLILSYPSFWYNDTDYPFDPAFDEWCLQKIKEGEIPEWDIGSDCVIKFAGKRFWHYSYGPSFWHLHEYGTDKVKPSRLTRIKLEKLLKQNKHNRKYKW